MFKYNVEWWFLQFIWQNFSPSKQSDGGPPGGPRRRLWRPAGGKRRGPPRESETGFAEGPPEAAPPETTVDHWGTAVDFRPSCPGISLGGPLDDFIHRSAVVKNEWDPRLKWNRFRRGTLSGKPTPRVGYVDNFLQRTPCDFLPSVP